VLSALATRGPGLASTPPSKPCSRPRRPPQARRHLSAFTPSGRPPTFRLSRFHGALHSGHKYDDAVPKGLDLPDPDAARSEWRLNQTPRATSSSSGGTPQRRSAPQRRRRPHTFVAIAVPLNHATFSREPSGPPSSARVPEQSSARQSASTVLRVGRGVTGSPKT
jgi:hypothetical protein